MDINAYTILEKRQEEDTYFHEQDERELAKEFLQEIQANQEAMKTESNEEEKEIDRKISTFLHEKHLSENLIKTLINTDLTNEYIRLLQALDFNDHDIENLQDLWRTKIELGKNDSINSTASNDSSSATYLSQDSLYLKKVLSKPLIKALREIVAKKPADPIEYLGHWLLHFKVCEERSIQRKEELELLINREELKMKEVFKDIEPTVSIARREEEYDEDWNYLNYGE